jgi:hypothetical protein
MTREFLLAAMVIGLMSLHIRWRRNKNFVTSSAVLV